MAKYLDFTKGILIKYLYTFPLKTGCDTATCFNISNMNNIKEGNE